MSWVLMHVYTNIYLLNPYNPEAYVQDFVYVWVWIF